MIRPEDVADLQPGDVVEITSEYWPAGCVVRGPLRIDRDGWLICADFPVRLDNGEPGGADRDELTLVERGPRLYVNHARGVPVPGDVAKDAAGLEPSGHTWHYLGDEEFGAKWWRFDDRLSGGQPQRLRLLVDGETGTVMQP